MCWITGALPWIGGAGIVYPGGCALALQGGFPCPGGVSISCGARSRIARGVPQDIVSGCIDAGSRFCLCRLQGARLGIGGPAGDDLHTCRRGFSIGLPGDSPRGSPGSRMGYIAAGRALLCALGRSCQGAPEIFREVSSFSPGQGEVRGSYLPQDRISPPGAGYCLKRGGVLLSGHINFGG